MPEYHVSDRRGTTKFLLWPNATVVEQVVNNLEMSLDEQACILKLLYE